MARHYCFPLWIWTGLKSICLKRKGFMLKDLVLKLRYLGSIPQTGYVEYGFRIEEDEEKFRLVVLSIEDGFFQNDRLKLQEAPDLCYQKVLSHLEQETAESDLPSRVKITAADIASYREIHPTSKMSKRARSGSRS